MPAHPWSFSGPTGEPFRLNRSSPQAVGLLAWFPPLASRGTNRLLDLGDCGLHGTPSNITWGGDVSGGWSTLFARTSSPQIDISALGGKVDVLEGSIALWARLDNNAGSFTGQLIDFRASGGEIEIVWLDGTTTLRLGYSAGGVNKRVNLAFTEDGKLRHHWVLTWSKSRDEVKAYQDGVQIGTTQTGLGTWSGAITTSLIGNNLFSDDSHGRLGDLRIYNRALAPVEVYQQWAPPTRWDLYALQRAPALWAPYYPFYFRRYVLQRGLQCA